MRKPPLIPPQHCLGLNREEAATYVGVGHTTFDAMVADGRMPRPKTVGARRIWSRIELENAFARLPAEAQDDAAGDPWADCHA